MGCFWAALLLGLLGISHIALGAQKIDVKERVQRSLNDVSSRRHPRSVQTNPEDLLGLEKDEHLKPQEMLMTSHNTVKVKYTEDYKGLPIIGESIVLEQTEDGKFTDDVSGSLLDGIAEDVPSIDPALSPEEAFTIALNKVDRNPEHITFRPDQDISLAIYTINRRQDVDNAQTRRVKAVLVYRVTIIVFDPSVASDPQVPVEMEVILDANTGKVLHTSDLLDHGSMRKKYIEKVMEIQATGGNEKIGLFIYGKDRESLKVETEDGITCKLQNEHVAVVNMNFTTDLNNLDSNLTQGYTFQCKEGIHDSINGAYSPLSDTYFYFNRVIDMYNEWYKIKPLKARVIMGAHYGIEAPVAFYMRGRNIMMIGDGNHLLYPLAVVGVVGHEITHGYTREHANLESAEQSGGMNEAFSDMASETAQAYVSSKSDWMLGYEFAKYDDAVKRWLYDPPRDKSSVASLQDYCPRMQVHYSSGIFNKAFYLLANRPGWDVRKAFHVFLMANTLYWRSKSDFADGACGAVKAAKDLGFPAEDVESVFLDVDIKPCVKRKYNFQNLIDTYVSPKNKFEKYIDIQGNSTDKITIEIWIGETEAANEEEVVYDLSVTFNGRKVVALKSNKSDSVDITNLQPGRYYITIKGNVPTVSVYVITAHIFHDEMKFGRHFDNKYAGNTSFTLVKGDVCPDQGIVLRVSGPDEYFYLRTSYSDPTQMHSIPYSNKGVQLSLVTQETMYCSIRPGLYEIKVGAYRMSPNVTFFIDAFTVYNLYPRTNF